MSVKTKNIEFERIIIKAILSSKDFCRKVFGKNFSEEIFENPIHRLVFKTASERFNKSADLITFDDIKYLAEKSSKTDDEKNLKFATIEKLKNELDAIPTNPQRYSFCWEELLRLFHVRKYFEYVEHGIERFSRDPNCDPIGVITDLERKFYDVRKKTNQILIESENIFDKQSISERIKKYESERGNPKRGLPYFLPKLTEITGGIKPTDFILVAGRQKSGKSIFLLNQGVYLAKLGYNVAYFAIEQGREELSLRADSLSTELRHIDIKLRKLQEHDESLFKARLLEQEKNGALFIIDVPRFCTMDVIERETKSLLDQGTNLNIVIVDYLGLISSGDSSGSDFYLNQGLKSQRMKELAREMKIPFLSANQMNRASEKEKVKGASSLANSDQIGNNVDYLFCLVNLGQNKGELQMALARDSGAENIPLLTNYERMVIMEAVIEEKDEEEGFDL